MVRLLQTGSRRGVPTTYEGHMVSASCSNAVVPGEDGGEVDEITAVPKLLDKLELSGCIVTLDAWDANER